MKAYKQTTAETCLASSLLLLLGVKPNQKKEIEILINGLKFTKWDFTIGQLDFVARKHRKNIVYYINDKKILRVFKKLPISKRVKIVQTNVNLKLIKKLIKFPLIVYIDDYVIRKEVHYPHFIVVWKFDKNKFVITDVWDGKIKKIKPSLLSRGMKLLRDKLKFNSEVIQIEKKP